MGLAFAPHLEIICVKDRGFVATGEDGCDLYGGRHFADVASLVDGSRSRRDILAACSNADREALDVGLSELLRRGVIVELPEAADVRDAAWWSSQRIPPQSAMSRIRTASVAVRALQGVDPGPTIEALAAAGARVTSDAEMTVVLVADYLDEGLGEINARALIDGRAWMLAQPATAQILIGPFFTPERGPCWECLAQRLRRLHGVERGLRRVLGVDVGSSRPVPGAAGLGVVGAALTAGELTRWLAGATREAQSHVLSFDPRSWESRRHRVEWRPQCPACGEPRASLQRGAQPIQFRPSSSGVCDGSLRTVPPNVTLERFEHHISSVSGAVPELRKVHGPDYAQVYSAGGRTAVEHGERAGWRELVGIDWLGLLGSSSAGKGSTDEQARASALGEALERYSGRFGGEEPRRRGALCELTDTALHPNAEMGFSETQYLRRLRWNETAPSFRTRVPEPFDPAAQIDWSPVWSLTHQRERLLPTSLCYFGAFVPGRQFCVPESTGSAAGNTIEEAILHGLLELIERDHVALWWYNRVSAPGVDLDSLSDPWLECLRTHVAEQGRELWALDLTADLGIPVAVMLVTSRDGSRIGMGCAAHLDLGRAVIRAATELVQFGLHDASGGVRVRGGQLPLYLDRYPFVRPHPGGRRRTINEWAVASADLFAALDRCQSAVESRGIEVLVLDLTRPDIGLPVAKVFAPGLRHLWSRLGPGRLYDVPAELGWVERPLEEHQLDPTPPMP